jgi:hypothetical protein
MNIKHIRNSIFSFDIDGTLCVDECWTEDECLKAIPNTKMINALNWLNLQGCYIKVYTARKEFLRFATEYWLKKHQIRYNELVMEKSWSEYYIDDRNVSMTEIYEYVKKHSTK